MSACTVYSLREATDAIKAGCTELDYQGTEPLPGTIIDIDEEKRLCLVKYDLLDGISFTVWAAEGDVLNPDGSPLPFSTQ